MAGRALGVAAGVRMVVNAKTLTCRAYRCRASWWQTAGSRVAGRSAARLWIPVAAWLVDDTGRQMYVAGAPAGASIRIDGVWRVGPLTADLRVLGSPQVTPRLWLVASWHGLDRNPTRTRLRAAAAQRS